MTRTRASASVAITTAVASVCALSGTVATPSAHADPLDGPRSAVERARADSNCPPLNYKVELENMAQQYARDRRVSKIHGDYSEGVADMAYGSGDPQSKAIDEMMAHGAAGGIRDCKYKDYGVGFFRYEQPAEDFVSIALGIPAPSP
jgi:hypothetical protein